MQDKKSIKDEEMMIKFDSLSNLTGFSTQLIKEELLKFEGDSKSNSDEISLNKLRKAMLAFIDETLLEKPNQ